MPVRYFSVEEYFSGWPINWKAIKPRKQTWIDRLRAALKKRRNSL